MSIPVRIPPDRPALHTENTYRCLRHTLWLSVYFAQDLDLPDLQDRIGPILREVDRHLEDIDREARR